MKRPSSSLIAAVVCYTWITAAAEESAKIEVDFSAPSFNVVDDLSDYGGDYSLPVSNTLPDRFNVGTPEPVPEAAAGEKSAADIDFTSAQFNTLDDLSDYGEDYAWPVTVRQSESLDDGLAISGEADD
jgi:hypothetical protein